VHLARLKEKGAQPERTPCRMVAKKGREGVDALPAPAEAAKPQTRQPPSSFQEHADNAPLGRWWHCGLSKKWPPRRSEAAGCALDRAAGMTQHPAHETSDPTQTVSRVITLGQMAALFADADLTMVDVSCDRRGRLSLARLLAEHGHAVPGSELRRIIARDCPRMIVVD
jgi:hypothetical protein